MSKRNERAEQIKKRIISKYDYLKPTEIDEIFEVAKTKYLNKKYPYHPDIVDIPESTPRAYEIVASIMEEIIQFTGISSFTAYSENGLSWKRDVSGISSSILADIVPEVGIVG